MAAPPELRNAGPSDLAFLEEMLFEAFAWNPDAPRPDPEATRALPELAKLLRGFGRRRGDAGVVAEREGEPLGAAWYRLWTGAEHSWGFVDERTPELAIAVRPGARGIGLGRALLRALLERARADGHPALSLSVDPANRARRLYEREGFRRVGASGTSWTLALEL
jgi:ribosomal protein S18 acetylase RimI-like enzyme